MADKQGGRQDITFNDSGEVVALVKALAYMAHSQNLDIPVDEKVLHGYQLFGYVVVESLEAMIADFENQINELRKAAGLEVHET
ncbi:hypothetical protein FACS1894137_16770 [Spirochaetia bacterium]|nr:hypothetical protein FACS1894137_16770 [Spirochaetia bacterium]